MLQLLRTFEAVTKTMVPFEIEARRTGDIVSMYANTTLAERELGWKSKYTLEQMCKCITAQVKGCRIELDLKH